MNIQQMRTTIAANRARLDAVEANVNQLEKQVNELVGAPVAPAVKRAVPKWAATSARASTGKPAKSPSTKKETAPKGRSAPVTTPAVKKVAAKKPTAAPTRKPDLGTANRRAAAPSTAPVVGVDADFDALG